MLFFGLWVSFVAGGLQKRDVCREHARSCVSVVASSLRCHSTIRSAAAHSVKIARAFCPQRVLFAAMVFTMQKNPYANAAGEKQGEKRTGTHEDNGSVPKKAKKAPAAASLVP